jgi:hypothetical protein
MICQCCFARELETIQEKEMGVCESCQEELLEETESELKESYEYDAIGFDDFEK